MRRDAAVAPVIAAMLVLAVIVTFFAVWNATAIPAMKEQAEVSHLHEVESGILRFSSDIESAASTPNNMKLSERIPLGGGDVLFSSTKSGGTLAIQDEDENRPYMVMEIYNRTDSGPDFTNRASFRLVNYSYRPSGNFWLDQGYVWSYGYVNVTKGTPDATPLETPLEFSTMSAVKYTLTGALFSASSSHNPADPCNCSVVILKGVSIKRVNSDRSMSGNGIGTLALNSTLIPTSISDVTRINMTISSPQPAFQNTLRESVNSSLNQNVLIPCRNIHLDTTPSTDSSILLTIDPGPTNVTVSRKITEILLSAH